MSNLTSFIMLHLILVFYSIAGILSKFAAGESFLSYKFCVLYGLIIFILFAYSLFWQQIIKKLDLTLAFANKSVTVVWGVIWGFILFNESINMGKLAGALIIITGVVIFSLADRREKKGE